METTNAVPDRDGLISYYAFPTSNRTLKAVSFLALLLIPQAGAHLSIPSKPYLKTCPEPTGYLSQPSMAYWEGKESNLFPQEMLTGFESRFSWECLSELIQQAHAMPLSPIPFPTYPTYHLHAANLWEAAGNALEHKNGTTLLPRSLPKGFRGITPSKGRGSCYWNAANHLSKLNQSGYHHREATLRVLAAKNLLVKNEKSQQAQRFSWAANECKKAFDLEESAGNLAEALTNRQLAKDFYIKSALLYEEKGGVLAEVKGASCWYAAANSAQEKERPALVSHAHKLIHQAWEHDGKPKLRSETFPYYTHLLQRLDQEIKQTSAIEKPSWGAFFYGLLFGQ